MDRTHRLTIICFILFSVLSVYFYIPLEDNFQPGPDEAYYLRYAFLVSQKGILEIRSFINDYANNVEAHLYPPPSRVGHIILTALWIKLFGAGFVSLAKFSFFCYCLFILVCLYFFKKFFGSDISYLVTLLVSSSPLIMAMAKRALLDSHANLFWALSIFLFIDFLATNKRAKFLIFLIVYAFSILVKESSVALLVFFITSLLVHKYYFKRPIPDSYFLSMVCVPLILVGASYVILLGGAVKFLYMVKNIFEAFFISASLNHYVKLFCAGPWYKYIIDYMLLNPITTLLFFGYAGYILVSRKWDWKILYFLLYFVIIFLLFNNQKNGKIIRYIMSLEIVLALFSVLMLHDLFSQKKTKAYSKLVFILALAIFLVNYLNFYHLFYQLNIYDPISYGLLIAKNIIPHM